MIQQSHVLLANGFLPTRGSFMLDLVCVSMLFIVVTLTFSLYQVRYARNKNLHRRLQVGMAVALLFVLAAFEIEIRFVTDWRELAMPSPFYKSGWVDRCLAVHLCFAIPTPFIWAALIVVSLRRFRDGFDQGSFNRFHRIWGRIAAGLMYFTSVTGWVFYYVAFVA